MHTLIHVQTYSCYFEIRFTYLVMYVLVLKLKVVSKFVNEDYGIIFFYVGYAHRILHHFLGTFLLWETHILFHYIATE